MEIYEMAILTVVGALTLILLCFTLRRLFVISSTLSSQTIDWSPLLVRIDEIKRSHGQTQELVLRECSLNRQEFVGQNQALRSDMSASIGALSEASSANVDNLVRSTDQKLGLLRNGIDQQLDRLVAEANRNSDQLSKSVSGAATSIRTESNERLNEFRTSLDISVRESHEVLREQTHFITSAIQGLQTSADQRQTGFENLVELKFSSLSLDTTGKLTGVITALNDNSKQLREETSGAMKQLGDTLIKTLTEMAHLQKKELQELRGAVDSRLSAIQTDNEKKLEQMRYSPLFGQKN